LKNDYFVIIGDFKLKNKKERLKGLCVFLDVKNFNDRVFKKK
jgi:hypothetical protein